MRDFFINSLEKILNVIVVLMAVAIIIGTLFVLFMGGQGFFGNLLSAILVLIGGALYLVLFAGMAYLGLGIYQNTKRTADLLERGAR